MRILRAVCIGAVLLVLCLVASADEHQVFSKPMIDFNPETYLCLRAIEPRELYELNVQVPNVVFPSGMIVDECDNDGFASMESPVRIYYGAADTVVGMATITIRELISSCENQK